MNTVVLQSFLHPDWCKLLWQLENECYPYARQVPAGECAIRWAMTDDAKVRELLGTAGIARFSTKSSTLMHLAADRGLDQAIYETFFEALGYKNNRLAFRTLAQSLPIDFLREIIQHETLESILFGYAGLIPDPTQATIQQDWVEYVNKLWDEWWHSGVSRQNTPKWSFAASRPFNSPFRRLAAGIGFLKVTECQPAKWLRAAVRSAGNSPKILIRLFTRLAQNDSPFCSLRDFEHKISPSGALLGQARLLDILANVLLPFINGIFENENGIDCHEAQLAKSAFLMLPVSQENRLFKEAVQRFMSPPSRITTLVKSVCHQQGLLDIYKNFCQALDNNCQLCPFVNS